MGRRLPVRREGKGFGEAQITSYPGNINVVEEKLDEGKNLKDSFKTGKREGK